MWLTLNSSSHSFREAISQKSSAPKQPTRMRLSGMGSGSFAYLTKIEHMKERSYRRVYQIQHQIRDESAYTKPRMDLFHFLKQQALHTQQYLSKKVVGTYTRCHQRKSPASNNRLIATALFPSVLVAATSIQANVLVMNSDGTLSQYEGTKQTLAFKQPETPIKEPARAQSRAPTKVPVSVPHPAVMAGIQEVALKYGGHEALRANGISLQQWMALFQANIEIESAYKTTARSHVGAIGLGQLMPETARRLGVDPHDMMQNLDGSARYLLMQLQEFGSVDLALAAYNAGPAAVRRYGGIPPYSETQGHVRKVRAVMARLI